MGICSRQGLGKLRHLDTHTLWIQQAVRTKAVDLRKIAGESNPADLFTKYSLSREKLISLTGLFDAEFRGGRAESAAAMRKAPGTKTTMAEADLEANAVVHERPSAMEECTPLMPHRVHSKEELLKLYPPLEVLEAVDAGDPTAEDEIRDPMIEAGLDEAQKIITAAELVGRKRRPDGARSERATV